MIDDVLARIDRDLPAAVARLCDFIRIPSVSADPARSSDCVSAAAWLREALAEIGFSSRLHETAGKPIVTASMPSRGRPRVLFYGHYDVQPADPANLWCSPPFEPAIGRNAAGGETIVGRGSADDKGQLLTFVEACRAWRQAADGLPVDVTMLFEGEEETGSAHLGKFIEDHRAELAADVALICDTNMWDSATPALVVALRGLLQAELMVEAANRDLHSGVYGGGAENPIHVLARIVAAIKDGNNRIALPGFYEDVRPAPDAVRRQWSRMGLTVEALLGPVGLAQPSGERGRDLVDQVQFRPTFDINGIVGGYTGEGTKTIIPARAAAKLSFRLVADQDPVKIMRTLESFVAARVPFDCRFRLDVQDLTPPAEVDAEAPALAVARAALQDEWGCEPVLVGSGGSIPVVSLFKRLLGVDTMLMGFGLDDDRIHAPDEKYDLACFRKGTRTWARFLGRCAG